MTVKLNDEVRSFWEQEACGSGVDIVGKLEPLTMEWFEQIENYRYDAEPFIFSVAQFPRHAGKKILEIGVGAGTDHLQWARCGATCFGVDLTQIAIETTATRLKMYGYTSTLQRVDAEQLPFDDNAFDIVYSWGVIHHSENPERIVAEIERVLKPNGKFIGMFYRRRSIFAIKLWIKHALLKGKFFMGLGGVLWNYMESIGTKAYDHHEIITIFRKFRNIELYPLLSKADTKGFPESLKNLIPSNFGFFVGIRATK